MKAILIKENKDLVWSDVGNPQPKDDEVVIDIKAAALNRADLMQREGNYPPPPGWPQWMGLEVAGVISYAPDNVKWNVGDRVCALLGGGGYAEKVAVPSGMVVSIPDGLSFEEAAAIPEAFATSYLNLCIEGGMKSGDTVFIQAGASGLGMAAIQLAKALGAKVVTTVGSEEKETFVKELGADVVINRKKEDIATVLKDHPVDVAMDCVAGKNLGPCIETMARGGRWIVIATLGGTISELNMLDFLMRGVKLIGSTLRSRTSEMKAEILSELEEKLWPPFTSGDIKILIHKTLPVKQAEDAHAILQNQQNLGKVVLTVK
ncbi:MAG: NAD(P)H-quinone oxidoreductase [Deltaproteobacteria bacterium]|uniref:NAD(P)H-quinone oxidoreductase n=1 Tax=Desulfobacula sp. TaxID=2593537 RepID=UPI0019BEFD84|nr:NAD(P)H-quinone oxidoreductase [Candidatus Desulfobacula maris]MBL6993847.1 NAD(P)H-quinone oxidoreductase [Desulfobacula sp.]